MADLNLHDVDEMFIERLKARAIEHGGTVASELNEILGREFMPEIHEDWSNPKYKRLYNLMVNGPKLPPELDHVFDRQGDHGRDIDFNDFK